MSPATHKNRKESPMKSLRKMDVWSTVGMPRLSQTALDSGCSSLAPCGFCSHNLKPLFPSETMFTMPVDTKDKKLLGVYILTRGGSVGGLWKSISVASVGDYP